MALEPTFALCRFDFGLDRSFGMNGVVVTDFLSQAAELPGAVAIDAFDQIIVAGTARDRDFGQRRWVLARYESDGQLDQLRGSLHPLNPRRTRLDSGFGRDGKVVTNFKSLQNERAQDVVFDQQGRIVVVGTGERSDGERVIALARYLPDGDLDDEFDGDGKVITDFFSRQHEWGRSVAVDSQNRIVVAGLARQGKRLDIALARYLEDGQLDPSFDLDGKVLAHFDNSYAKDIAISAGDKILVVGRIDQSNWGLARFNNDGSIDSSFGSSGITKSGFASHFRTLNAVKIATDRSDRIIVAGTGIRKSGDDRFRWVVARYKDNGNLDPQFGAGKGWVQFNVGGGQFDNLQDMTIDRAGRIVLAGRVSDVDDRFVYNAVGRLFPGGEPDRTLDNGNGFSLAPRHLSHRAHAVSVAADTRNGVYIASTFERDVRSGSGDTVTGFLPSLHGWRFENDLIVHRFFNLPAGLEAVREMTFCGGMALGAKDHYDFDRTLPDRQTPPEDRSKLFNYIWRRQLDSLGKKKLISIPAGGPWGREFRRWWKMAGSHVDDPAEECPGRRETDLWGAARVLDWSMRELGKIERMLTINRETVLIGFIRDSAENLWDNHQVLAYHFEREGSHELDPAVIHIYDPNYPGDDNQRIRVTFTEREFFTLGESDEPDPTIDTIELLPTRSNGDHRCLRGFFQMNEGWGRLPDIRSAAPPSNLLLEIVI